MKKEFKEKAIGEDQQTKEADLFASINDIFKEIVGENNQKLKVKTFFK
jgi:hypothetical protein